MTLNQTVTDDGVAVVTMHHPPVNAITVADTWAIRDTFAELAETPGVRAAILTAEGKGFNAGIDIKEMQSSQGSYDFLLGSGAACFAAFEQIYRSPFPVIAAVNDFCMGLGVGLVGSCDILVGVDQGPVRPTRGRQRRVGCASHLAKLVPPFKLRQMVFTCER